MVVNGATLANTAIEKYLKALCVHLGLPTERTHSTLDLYAAIKASSKSNIALNESFLAVLARAYGFWRELDREGRAAGIGHLGTHTFRHSYRMWIDALGTTVGVQKKLMRRADIRTTMNIYGDASLADMREAQFKIVQMALQPMNVRWGFSNH